MALGAPAETANRIGYADRVPLDGRGITQVAAAEILRDNTNIAMGTSAGDTAFILPADAEYFQPYFLLNTTAESALVFPPVGDTIDAGSVNGAINVDLDTARIVQRVEEGRWVSVSTAAAPEAGIAYASDLAALAAFNTTRYPVVWLKEAGREGVFAWTAGDFSAHVAADPLEGIYVESGSKPSFLGAWVRQYSGSLDIRWWGALVDDVANDKPAVDAAFAVADFIGGADVWFPDGSAYIGDAEGIVCPGGSSVSSGPQAELHYLGSGTALTINGPAQIARRGITHFLPLIRRANTVDWNLGTDTTSAGLRIVDCYGHTFFVPGVLRFCKGIVAEAAAGNCVCNTVNLGRIVNNQTSIDFLVTGVGVGVNQNQFNGGVLVIDSAYTAVSPRYLINMPHVENNTNTFIGVNMEASGQEKAIVCASSSNLWLNCRFEAGQLIAGYITFAATGIGNKIIGASPVHPTTPPYVTYISDGGFENIYIFGNVIASKYFLFNSDSSFPIRLGNGSTVPNDSAIGAYGTNRIRLGIPGTTLGTRFCGLLMQDEATVTSGTTIPARNSWTLTYAGATTITGLIGGLFSDITGIASVMSTNGNATLQHTASPAAGAGKFVLKAGVDKTLVANTPVMFMMSGGNLYEA